jgi:hypothetical protein
MVLVSSTLISDADCELGDESGGVFGADKQCWGFEQQ